MQSPRHAGVDPTIGVSDSEIPLCVDLDGTLIDTDMLYESFVDVWSRSPWRCVLMCLSVVRGRAFVKRKFALVASIDASVLPYNAPLLAYLGGEKGRGRRLVLTSASDSIHGDAVARHLSMFDEVMCSDGVSNLRGSKKAVALVERFGPRGFDYAGNDANDFAVWDRARKAVLVNLPADLGDMARQRYDIAWSVDSGKTDFGFFSLLVGKVSSWVKSLVFLSR